MLLISSSLSPVVANCIYLLSKLRKDFEHERASDLVYEVNAG